METCESAQGAKPKKGTSVPKPEKTSKNTSPISKEEDSDLRMDSDKGKEVKQLLKYRAAALNKKSSIRGRCLKHI